MPHRSYSVGCRGGGSREVGVVVLIEEWEAGKWERVVGEQEQGREIGP